MDVGEQIAELARRGVSLRIENDRLRVSLTDRRLEAEVRALLERHGAAIIDHLKSVDGAAADVEPQPETAEALGDLCDSPHVSSGQRRLWFLAQQFPGTVAHHVSMSWTGRGPIDRELTAAGSEMTPAGLLGRRRDREFVFEQRVDRIAGGFSEDPAVGRRVVGREQSAGDRSACMPTTG